MNRAVKWLGANWPGILALLFFAIIGTLSLDSAETKQDAIERQRQAIYDTMEGT
jgi:hypothetical protein